MRVYGNLVNRIIESSNGPPPEVGMPATMYLFSDRLPATVTAISPTGKTITLTEDMVTEWKDYYGVSFARNEHGRTYLARRGKGGHWRCLKSGHGVTLGSRAAYWDPGF